MPCYGCGTDYSTFKKEHGCKNCGMSFCMKCLPNKYPIVRLNNEKHRVCMKCYNILTGKIKQPDKEKMKYSPPENYKKRMAVLEEREAKGHQGTSHGQGHGLGHGHTAGLGKSQKQPNNMTKEDLEIQQRLEKLREKSPSEKAAGQVSEKEINDRLAKLKGMDPSRYSNSNTQGNQQRYYHPPERRTQQEQMNDLLDEICHEVDLDANLPNPITEIENRLAQLKDRSNSQSKETDENNLNKTSVPDSKTFSQNISNTSSDVSAPKTDTTSPSELPVSTDTKPTNSSGEDPISPEEINKILSETAQELEEDAKKAIKGLEEDKDIMRQLQQLKQKRKESTTDINKDEAVETSDSENEDKMADNVIKQALEEAKLDEAAAKDGVKVDNLNTKSKKGMAKKEKLRNGEEKVKNNKEDEEWYDPDELPYCCLCTEDAVVRCMGCERDLYCNKCFREAHKELGLDDHVTIKYTAPKENT